MLKKGDKVVMHTCGEAKHYKGKLWTCKGDEFTSSAHEQVVFLEGFSGYFLVEYLQFVDFPEIEFVNCGFEEERYALQEEIINLNEWKEKATNTMKITEGIINSLEQQNELLKEENDVLRRTMDQVKNTIANDVFALLSQINKETR